MDLQTTSNIVLGALSFILAFISLVFLGVTLSQNKKMLENSTRPYITIYFDYTQMGAITGYFVIKNFGNSSAVIDKLTFNKSIKEHPTLASDLPGIFNGLVGNSIAPNQKFFAPFHFEDYPGGIAVFDIFYHSDKKKYSEHIEINIENYAKLVKPRLGTNEFKAISYPLHEIAERLM
ncbi:MAG: hypothetical protein HFI14_08875 [Lachnospiraceae bacterium]|nr:hypothetical protein [Lachnospiraceae bacterium]